MYVNLILGSVDIENSSDLERVIDMRGGWKELVESGKVSKESALALVKLSLENRFSYEWRDHFDFVKGGVVKWEVCPVAPNEEGRSVPWLQRRKCVYTVEYVLNANTIEPVDDLPEQLEDFLRAGLQHDAGGRGEYFRELFDASTKESRAKELSREDEKKERLYFRALRQISVRG